MDWQAIEAQILAEIDREIGDHSLAPAEYEIVRRTISETGDFDYQTALAFSERALQSGAAALAARSTVLVDVPTVQVSVAAKLQQTFANSIYCAADTLTRRQKEHAETPIADGMQQLAQRYPEAVVAIGKDRASSLVLVEAIEEETIRPALVIFTPPAFLYTDDIKQRLRKLLVPSICTLQRKGGAAVAGAILGGLIDLAWQAYRQADDME